MAKFPKGQLSTATKDVYSKNHLAETPAINIGLQNTPKKPQMPAVKSDEYERKALFCPINAFSKISLKDILGVRD